jgi:hypothetical protein
MEIPASGPAAVETIRARGFQEPPPAAGLGFRFHHIGIPTRTRQPGEHYIASLKVWAAGFETSLYGIEWLRFEADSPVPLLVQSVPHVAFEVDDLDAALAGKEVIYPPFEPFAGVRSAMILDHGAPVEIMKFR